MFVGDRGTMVEQRFCTQCGRLVNPADSFCASCGHAVGTVDMEEVVRDSYGPAEPPESVDDTLTTEAASAAPVHPVVREEQKYPQGTKRAANRARLWLGLGAVLMVVVGGLWYWAARSTEATYGFTGVPQEQAIEKCSHYTPEQMSHQIIADYCRAAGWFTFAGPTANELSPSLTSSGTNPAPSVPEIKAARCARRGPRVNLSTCDLSSQDLSGQNFVYGVLIDAVLRSANLEGTSLVKANLSGGDFSGTRMVDSNLTEANLLKVNFDGAEMYRVVMQGSYAARASFKSANLQGADLSGADLTDADFSGANLQGADLSGADLFGASLTHTNLAGTDYDKKTQWPKGFKPPPLRS
jgi:hypothetical protein